MRVLPGGFGCDLPEVLFGKPVPATLDRPQEKRPILDRLHDKCHTACSIGGRKNSSLLDVLGKIKKRYPNDGIPRNQLPPFRKTAIFSHSWGLKLAGG